MNDPDVKLYCVVLRDSSNNRPDRILRVGAYTAHDAGVQAALEIQRMPGLFGSPGTEERIFAIEPWTKAHEERFGGNYSSKVTDNNFALSTKVFRQ